MTGSSLSGKNGTVLGRCNNKSLQLQTLAAGRSAGCVSHRLILTNIFSLGNCVNMPHFTCWELPSTNSFLLCSLTGNWEFEDASDTLALSTDPGRKTGWTLVVRACISTKNWNTVTLILLFLVFTFLD